MPVPQTTHLTRATDGLYSVFVRYPAFRHRADCPHCAAQPGWREIFDRPIRQLTASNLNDLAASVLIPGVDVDELKHFLPRLLELHLKGELAADSEALFFTLTRGGWRSWPGAEVAALDRWLRAYWQAVLSDVALLSAFEVERGLCAIAQAVDDLRGYLNTWRSSSPSPGPTHLAHFIIATNDARRKRGRLRDPFWDNRPTQLAQVVAWLADPVTRDNLEEAFFRDADPENEYYLALAVDLLAEEGI